MRHSRTEVLTGWNSVPDAFGGQCGARGLFLAAPCASPQHIVAAGRGDVILLLVTDIEQSTYRPIQDLPPDWPELEVRELRSLDLVWREQRERLNELDELVRFRERLIRSWAIETGVLERVYSIDRGVTEILVAEGLKQGLLDGATDRDPAEVIAILRDHQEAIEGVFDFVAGRRDLSTSYIKEVHALLTRNQPTVTAIDQFGRTFETELCHGDWKVQPNNPRRVDETVHAYCPPEHVAAEMDLLIELHAQHCESNVGPTVASVGRFTVPEVAGRVRRA